MVKKMCVSVSERTYNNYFAQYSGNKSRFFEDNFLNGIDANSGELPTLKIRIDKLNSDLRNVLEDNRKLRLTVENYKARMNKKYAKYIKAHPDWTIPEIEARIQEIENRKKFVRAVQNASLDDD